MGTLIKIITTGVLWLVLSCLACFGQLTAPYSEYLVNPNLVNPAAYNQTSGNALLLSLRTNWLAFQGAPNEQGLSFLSNINPKLAWGATVSSTQFGPSRHTQIAPSFTYRVPLSDGYFAFGIRPSFGNHSFNSSLITYKSSSDNLGTVGQNEWLFNSDAGAYLHLPKFNFGLSVLNIRKLALTEIETGAREIGNNRSFVFTGNYNAKITNEIAFKPGVLVQSNGYELIAEASAVFLFREAIVAGLSFRSEASFGVMVNYLIKKKLIVGYAFNVNTYGPVQPANTAHEVLIGYRFNKAK